MEDSPAKIAFEAIHETLYPDLTCTYQHESCQVYNVPANRGRSTLVDEDGQGGRIENAAIDFIIPGQPLSEFGQGFTPQKGDTIVIRGGTNQWVYAQSTYELMTPPYSPHDLNGEYFRLHTKLIEFIP